MVKFKTFAASCLECTCCVLFLVVRVSGWVDRDIPKLMATFNIKFSEHSNRNELLPRGNPVLHCEWRPPDDVPIGPPPVEFPPDTPEEEPFIPEVEPPPPPDEKPQEKEPVTTSPVFTGTTNTFKPEGFYHVRH